MQQVIRGLGGIVALLSSSVIVFAVCVYAYRYPNAEHTLLALVVSVLAILVLMGMYQVAGAPEYYIPAPTLDEYGGDPYSDEGHYVGDLRVRVTSHGRLTVYISEVYDGYGWRRQRCGQRLYRWPLRVVSDGPAERSPQSDLKEHG